jgi:hypothetical protein
MAATKKKSVKPAAATTTHPGPRKTPFEEGLQVWTNFAKQTGDTFGEFLRRYGEEQQKNYERWVASLKESSIPAPSTRETDQMRARFEQWNKASKEIADRVREAFLTTLGPQRETFEAWMRPFLPKESSVEEQTNEFTELVTKFWTGMFSDASRKFVEGLQTSKSPMEFAKLQENALREFGENYQKLAYAYFSSPAFVGLFGRTLDASLELQKAFDQGDSVLSKVTGLPTRRDITELNQSVRELLIKMDRPGKGD